MVDSKSSLKRCVDTEAETPGKYPVTKKQRTGEISFDPPVFLNMSDLVLQSSMEMAIDGAMRHRYLIYTCEIQEYDGLEGIDYLQLYCDPTTEPMEQEISIHPEEDEDGKENDSQGIRGTDIWSEEYKQTKWKCPGCLCTYDSNTKTCVMC